MSKPTKGANLFRICLFLSCKRSRLSSDAVPGYAPKVPPFSTDGHLNHPALLERFPPIARTASRRIGLQRVTYYQPRWQHRVGARSESEYRNAMGV